MQADSGLGLGASLRGSMSLVGKESMEHRTCAGQPLPRLTVTKRQQVEAVAMAEGVRGQARVSRVRGCRKKQLASGLNDDT